jgi:2-succinyl-5-enolpyruvyl-6-hydroxy-3-cyclohexene-1-carboxylate synthase
LSSSLIDLAPEDVQATFCAVLVDSWIQQGLRYAAVAPGSRSTPLTLALSTDERVTVDVFHDERSAAFAALGFGVATGQAAVVVCTSGTAAAHFYAAIIEADLSGVPLLVCTADRPPELRDVGAPQTIDQIKMFGTTVRWFHDPGVPTAANASSWQSLAERSLAKTGGLNPGPVHLNLPFREPLVGRALSTPPLTPESRFGFAEQILSNSEIDHVVQRLNQAGSPDGRGIIIAGRGCGDPAVVNAVAEYLHWPVFADSRSGCQGQSQAVIHFDSLLRSEAVTTSMVPHVVLRLGESPSSKVLNQWVSASKATEIHISARPSVYDPQHGIALHITADPTDVLQRLLHDGVMNVSGAWPEAQAETWTELWFHNDHVARKVLADQDDDHLMNGIAVARSVVSGLRSGSHLVLSSSMPIRDVEWFGGDCSHVTVHANRGANGIDGVMATAAGVARGSGAPTTVLIGDVAVIHDASTLASLAIADVDVRIVVVDNNGGGIFHHLAQASTVDAAVFEKIYGTPHQADLVKVAQGFGLSAETVSTKSALHDALLLSGPRLIRIVTQRDADVVAHRQAHIRIAQAVSQATS